MTALIGTQSTTFKNVIPEHIRVAYPKFVEFLQVYYDFMATENSPSWLIENLSENLDIDGATDTFLQMLKNEVGTLIPNSHAVDKRMFLKHIREIYAAKGSRQSIESFFNLIYATSATVVYPAEQMLRVSAGKWSKDISIRCQLLTGSIVGLEGGTAFGSVSNSYATIDHIEYFTYKGYKVYEIFLDFGSISGSFVIGETITVGTSTFRVYPIFQSITITNGGHGYSAGLTLPIVNPVGIGIEGKVYIDNVGFDGSIKSISIIDFGVDVKQPNVPTVTVTGIVVTGITISTLIYNLDLTGYGDGTAQVEIEISTMCRYRGRFIDSSGMVSNTNRIQDSYYYQQFSYLIQSILPFSAYGETMKRTHPAGNIMFGETRLINTSTPSAPIVTSSIILS